MFLAIFYGACYCLFCVQNVLKWSWVYSIKVRRFQDQMNMFVRLQQGTVLYDNFCIDRSGISWKCEIITLLISSRIKLHYTTWTFRLSKQTNNSQSSFWPPLPTCWHNKSSEKSCWTKPGHHSCALFWLLYNFLKFYFTLIFDDF